MDTFVYSALGAKAADARPSSPQLCDALDHASREDWRSAYHLLQQALDVPVDQRAAHFMLWEVCQVMGFPDVAMAHLREVLRSSPLTSRHSAAPRRRVLVLAVPGDFQANLPLGALFDAADTELHTLWLSDPDMVLRDPVSFLAIGMPRVDCVFISIAEDVRHRRALEAADVLASVLDKPVINCGGKVAAVSRAGAARLLDTLPNTIVPAQMLVERSGLVGLANGSRLGVTVDFPVIVRPSDSHAGKDLARIETREAMLTYLDNVEGNRFYVASFIDYRSADGLWRKYRIIFVDGRPWPYHMAIHDDWAIWYYNAHMDRDAWKRLEEARFVGNIADTFPALALDALQELGARVGLDYFGIDCGLMPDGRLVMFEIETGMIVHDWDSPELYPYKRGCAQRIRNAAERMIDERTHQWRRYAA